MVKTRLVNVALFLAILLGLALMIWVVLPRLALSGSSPKIYNTAILLKQVQTLSQLVTVKYVLEKVVILDDPGLLDLSLADSRVLMVAHGVVKAGVDLGEIRPEDIS